MVGGIIIDIGFIEVLVLIMFLLFILGVLCVDYE